MAEFNEAAAKEVQDRVDGLLAEARAYLIKAAVDSIYYVALGRVLRREMAEKFGLTEQHVEGLLSKASVKLADEIRAL